MGLTVAGRLCRCSHEREQRVLHTHLHPASVGTAESCGTAPSVTTTVLLPCAQAPLTAHGSSTTTHNAYWKSPSFQQKTATAPQRPRSPMCTIEDDRTHQAHQAPSQPTHHKLEPEVDRSRHGVRPISSRNWTDLEPEVDRSRHGIRPISSWNWTDLDAEYDRSRRIS